MEFLPAIVSGIEGGLNLLSQNIRHKHEKRIQEKQFAQEREMAEYGYGKDLEMWNLANAYNAPLAQMQRLKAAGLNPNLIYGKGSASTGVASQVTPKYQHVRPQYSYSAPIADLNVFGSVLSQYQDFKLKNAQIDLVRNQAKIKEDEGAYSQGYYLGRAGSQQTKYWTDRQKYNWLTQIDPVTGLSKGFKLFDTQLQAREMAIQNMESQMDYRDTQERYYLTKIFGPEVMKMARQIAGRSLGAGARMRQQGMKQYRVNPVNYPRFN